MGADNETKKALVDKLRDLADSIAVGSIEPLGMSLTCGYYEVPTHSGYVEKVPNGEISITITYKKSK